MSEFKRMFKRALIIASVIIASTTVSFAWFYTSYTAYLEGLEVSPKKEVAGSILIAESGSTSFSEGYSINESVSLYPCKSNDGISFFKEDLTQVGDNPEYVFKKTYYIKSSSATLKFKVASIEVTGGEIAKSLRVSVYYSGQCLTYAPIRGTANKCVPIGTYYTQPLDTNVATMVIRVWYDGTDEACTDENFGGGSTIKINFEGN